MLHSPCSDSAGESIHQGTIHSLVGDMEGVSGVIVVKGHQIDTLKVRKLCLIQNVASLILRAIGKAEGAGNTVGGAGAKQGGACTYALLQSGDRGCIVGTSSGKQEVTGNRAAVFRGDGIWKNGKAVLPPGRKAIDAEMFNHGGSVMGKPDINSGCRQGFLRQFLAGGIQLIGEINFLRISMYSGGILHAKEIRLG